MSVALNIDIPDDLAAALQALAKSAKTNPDAVVQKALERYLQTLEDQLDNEEADQVLTEPEEVWRSLAEVKKDFGL